MEYLLEFFGDYGVLGVVIAIIALIVAIGSKRPSHKTNQNESKVNTGERNHGGMVNKMAVGLFFLSVVWVIIFVWKKNNNVIIPNIYNMTYDNAKKVLRDAGLELGKVEYAFNDEIQEGRIVNYSLSAQRIVGKGRIVDVVISNGVVLPPVQNPAGPMIGEEDDGLNEVNTDDEKSASITPEPQVEIPKPHAHKLVIDQEKGKYCEECGEVVARWTLYKDWTSEKLQAAGDEKLEIKIQTESGYYGVNYYWWKDADLQIHKSAKGVVPTGYSLGKTYSESEINEKGKKDTIYHGITTGYYNTGKEGKTNYKFNIEISDTLYPDKDSIPEYYLTYRKDSKDVTYYRLWRLE